MTDPYKLSNDRSTAVSTTVEWLPMETAPLGTKIQVLNLGMVATQTVLAAADRKDWLGWQSLPLIPEWLKKKLEARIERR